MIATSQDEDGQVELIICSDMLKQWVEPPNLCLDTF